MTNRLKKAFDEASKLSDSEQDALAEWLLQEMKSEREWTKQFGQSADRMAELADEAVEEYESGETQELDPKSL